MGLWVGCIYRTKVYMTQIKTPIILDFQFLKINNMHLNFTAACMQLHTIFGKVQSELQCLCSSITANANNRVTKAIPNNL